MATKNIKKNDNKNDNKKPVLSTNMKKSKGVVICIGDNRIWIQDGSQVVTRDGDFSKYKCGDVIEY